MVRKLGVGGMAETFAAVRSLGDGVDQSVCLKRILPAYADDAAYVELFRREATVATGLVHPNIVALLDVAIDELEQEAPYLVLELVDGIDLRALLATAPGRKLDADVVGFLAVELAHALHYAHTATGSRPAIVHRDLSPSNVLLSRGGDVKLADFGLAKPIHHDGPTTSGNVRGKIAYLAPELLRAEPVDGRVDLFALGVTLYECLAGQRPFDGAHEIETMTRVLRNLREPLASLAPDAPAELVALVERLIAPDREDRPASARDLLEALDAIPAPVLARSTLLDLVESRLGGAESRLHVTRERRSSAPAVEVVVPIDAAEPTSATAIVRPRPARRTESERPESSTPPATASDRPRSRRVVALSVVVAASLGALGFAGLRGRGDPERDLARTAADTTTDTRPVVVAASDHPPAPVAAATSEARPAVDVPQGGGAVPAASAPDPAAEAETSETSTSPNATVRVYVSPWGDAWIDGRHVGRAPTSVELTPGPHRIGGGQDRQRVTRRVFVRAGERRTVSIDLSTAQ